MQDWEFEYQTNSWQIEIWRSKSLELYIESYSRKKSILEQTKDVTMEGIQHITNSNSTTANFVDEDEENQTEEEDSDDKEVT